MTPVRLSPVRAPERLILFALLALLVLFLVRFDGLWDWDQVIYDGYVRLASRPPAEDILVVAIDEQSLLELGRWPWPRTRHAELLQRLTQAGARAVALDIIFAEPDTNAPQADAQLAQAIAENARTLLPVAQAQTRVGGPLVELLPTPPLAELAAGLGHVDVELDRDGVARSLYLRAGLAEPHWPHLGLRLLELGGEEPAQRLPRPRSAAEEGGSHMVWVRDQRVWIPFAGPPGHFRHASFVDVLRGDFPPEAIRDRYVLVGATATGLGDVLPTPVSGESRPMAGVELVANTLDALRQGLLIQPMARTPRLLLSLSLVLAPLLLYLYVAPRWALAFALVSLLASAGLSLLLLHWARLWFPPSAVLLCSLLGYILWSWSRLVRTVGYLNQELLRLHSEPAALPERRAYALEETMGFLRRLLPLSGCTLQDASATVLDAWGEDPGSPPQRVSAGSWTLGEGNLWTALPGGTRTTLRLGLRWHGPAPPDEAQQRLLRALVAQLGPETPPRRHGPLEVVQARIQQVQDATARLRAMRRFISDSLSQMTDGVLVANTLGQVLLCNQNAAEYLLESPGKDLAGSSLWELLVTMEVSADTQIPQALRSVLFEQRAAQFPARSLAGRDLLVELAPFAGAGSSVSGVIVNLVDISPLRASERRRAELLGFLSHDLRSPLVSVISIAQLAALQPQRLAEPTLMQRIEDYTRRALDLADDFLRLARADSADELSIEPVDMRAIAQSALQQVEPQAEAKGIRLQLRASCADASAEGDEELLERTLINLLSNGVKYSPQGAGITVTVECSEDEIQCSVEDTGYGISAQDLPRIFDRFQRLQRSEHKREKGAGLGLALVKSVIDRHGGRVEVSSELGKGTCFRLYLPRRRAGA